MIERLRQRIRAMHSITRPVKPEDRDRVVEYLTKNLGFVVMEEKLRRDKELGEHYAMVFMRELRVIADTERGDKIAYDGRYETK